LLSFAAFQEPAEGSARRTQVLKINMIKGKRNSNRAGPQEQAA